MCLMLYIGTAKDLPLTSSAEPPKGVIDWQFDGLDPERLFFNEQCMHVVHNRRGEP
jgi:hypothetical protein